MTPRPRTRRGFTIFELLVVLVLLIILAAAVIPGTEALYGDTRAKAAADQVRGELAAARAWAVEDGEPVRVAVSPDGRTLRRAAESGFDQAGGATESTAGARRAEVAFEKVTAEVQTDGQPAEPAADGWVTVAVFLPDGTCRTPPGTNPTHTVALREDGRSAAGLRVSVHALTGRTRVSTPKAGGGQ